MKRRITTLDQALVRDLERLYCGELKLKAKLSRVLSGIHSKALQETFQEYLESSESKRLNIDRVFSYLNHEPEACNTPITDELIDAVFEHFTFAGDLPIQDLLLTYCLQRINNFKLSLYESSLHFADELELEAPSDLLATIVCWESQTKEVLDRLAVTQLNACSSLVVV